MPKQIPAALAEALICAVQKRACLYDTRLPAYRNRNVAELAWKCVADEVQKDVSFCKAMWASLRATFNRNLMRAKNKPSGTAKPIKWAFYPHMLFLQDHVLHGQGTGYLPHSPNLTQLETVKKETEESEEFVLEDDSQGLESQPVWSDDEDSSSSSTRSIQLNVDPVPSSSDMSLVMTVETPPALAPNSKTSTRSTASSPAPVTDTSGSGTGRKRKIEDPVEHENMHFVQHNNLNKLVPVPLTLNVARAGEEESMAAFGHLLPFYRKLPPLKQMKFLHHISGYLMELYAECFPQ